jgi:hypothetical protein
MQNRHLLFPSEKILIQSCVRVFSGTKNYIDETRSVKDDFFKEDELCCNVLKVIFLGPKRNPKNLFLGVFWIILLQLIKSKTLSKNQYNPLKTS